MGFRVGVIEFATECNTFTLKRSDLSAFLSSRYFKGDEVFAKLGGTNSEVNGSIEAAKRLGWKLIPVVSAHAQPGGIVTEAARLEITAEVRRRLQENMPFDGLFIALHGAMVTESGHDGESQFLKEVRAVVGDIPIAVTLDLHANIFDEMVSLADIAVSYRTYPHIDMNDRAEEACDLLHRAMSGEIMPRIAIDRPPMLLGCDDGRTTNDGPMCRILERAAREMETPGILNVAINAGFTDADVFAAGPTVLVTYDDKLVTRGQAAAVSEGLCNTIWSYRHDWAKPIDLATCIDRLVSHKPGGKPVVVADYSDNPGAGAYGDCTAILSALIEAGLENAALGALCDPEAAALLNRAGTGAELTLKIGGKSDPGVGGGPLELTGRVMAISPDGRFRFEGPMTAGVPGSLGPSACFRTHGIDVMITSEPLQMKDQNIFRVVGIEAAEKQIVVVKSMQHFRGAFEPIAEEVLVTDAGGLCTPDVTLRNYQYLRRPVFPLDTVHYG